MFSKLTSSVLLRRVGMLSVGVAAGQAITLLASPVLTRLLDPQTFGLFGLFTSLAFLIGNVSSLRYDLGIVLAKGEGMAASLWGLCITIVFSIAAIFGLFLVSGGGDIVARLMSSDALTDVLPWVPLQVISIGLFLSGSQWATRHKVYRPQALYQFSRAAVLASLQIITAFLAWGVHGLVAAQIIAFFFAAGVLIKQAVWPHRRILMHGYSWRRMKVAAIRFRRLPQFTAPQDLLTSLTQNLPYFILGSFFGANVVGWYWLTIRTMQLPINFISQSIRQVLLQHISARVNNRQRAFPSALKASLGLAAFGGVIFSPVIAFGPYIFGFIFGDEWREAGEYARWVGLWMLTVLVKIPAWCIFHTYGRQKLQFIFEILMFICQLMALLSISYNYDSVYAIAGYTSICVVFNFVMIVTALSIARNNDKEWS
ncbi:hypothetical protein TM49_16820 [Martelella endophytica]|uniref:Polysaccharide biosynthesis protein n=2 Tax=Martelella endophytica TaxID=1486262 RepID=A0A0D5LS06_MAREN|nr:hypothetical protein TM49_16820 [Martelella endophytica]